jgi:hypothetical protein
MSYQSAPQAASHLAKYKLVRDPRACMKCGLLSADGQGADLLALLDWCCNSTGIASLRYQVIGLTRSRIWHAMNTCGCTAAWRARSRVAHHDVWLWQSPSWCSLGRAFESSIGSTWISMHIPKRLAGLPMCAALVQ